MKMRVLLIAIALILTMASIAVRAEIDSSGLLYDDSGLNPRIYCYDYYFLDNKGFDTRLFSGNKSNTTFIDDYDISSHEGRKRCGTYMMTDSAHVNMFDPFADKSEKVDYSTEQSDLLPASGIGFIEEGSLGFDQFKSQDTVVYGGILPFVALPDSDLESEDSVINQDSFSLFFYFKKKF